MGSLVPLALGLTTGCAVLGPSGGGTRQAERTVTSAEAPPLYVFYVVHLHLSDDRLPYSDPGLALLDQQAAAHMVAITEAIAEVADRYDFPISWHPVYASAKGIGAYEGDDNVLVRLKASGHELGVHSHDVTEIDDADGVSEALGLAPTVVSAGLTEASQSRDAQQTICDTWESCARIGLSVTVNNLSPEDNVSPFGSLCGNVLGEGNDMWRETGNLMFPWKPDYEGDNVCEHADDGRIVYVDHVTPSWLNASGRKANLLSDTEFSMLRGWFDNALLYMEAEQPERVAAWGFVTHLSEFTARSDGTMGPDQGALDAFESFLAYVDEQRAAGRVVYATPGEIAQQAYGTLQPVGGTADFDTILGDEPSGPAGPRGGQPRGRGGPGPR